MVFRVRTYNAIALLLFCAPLLAASPALASFAWPDPSTHTRVIFNADQSIGGYLTDHPEWFKNDFLVTSFYIKDVEFGHSDDATHTYLFIQDKLWHDRITIGTYISGTTAIPDLQVSKYPANAVSVEDISYKVHYLGPWIREPEQKVVDLSDTFSRDTLDNGIGDAWNRAHGLVRFIDNAAVHPKVAQMQSWENYCANIKALRQKAEGRGWSSIFNVFVRSWELNDKETTQLIDALVGGHNNAISFPIPWSRSIKDDKTANAWAIYRYRKMLDAGIVLIFLPSADANEYELYAWLATWRMPADRVYIAAPYWEPPPGG